MNALLAFAPGFVLALDANAQVDSTVVSKDQPGCIADATQARKVAAGLGPFCATGNVIHRFGGSAASANQNGSGNTVAVMQH